MLLRLNVEHFVLLGLLAAPLHWIVGRSEIGKPLWSRTRGWFAKLLACPACSGFWLGLGLHAVGVTPVQATHPVAEFLAAGVLATFLTPIAQAAMLLGLRASAVPTSEPEIDGAVPEPLDVTPVEDPSGDVPPTSPPPR